MENSEIIKIYVDNGLIERCCIYQFGKLKEKWKVQYSGDMMDDLIVWMADYPNEKLNNIHDNKHMNAWLTRVLQNNIMSSSSKFYNTYIKFNARTDDLKEVEVEDEE